MIITLAVVSQTLTTAKTYTVRLDRSLIITLAVVSQTKTNAILFIVTTTNMLITPRAAAFKLCQSAIATTCSVHRDTI